MDILQVLDYVPNYKTFYTVDELDHQIQQLAKKYPDVIRTDIIGMSRNGHPIQAMIMGSGDKNALCFACPHPNEPIGAMTMIALGDFLRASGSLAGNGIHMVLDSLHRPGWHAVK